MRKILTAWAFLAIGVLSVKAGEVPHEEAGVKVTIPDDWEMELDEENEILMATHADEAMVLFTVVEATELEAAVDALADELAAFIKDAEVGDPEEKEVNGMQAVTASGTGSVEDEGEKYPVAFGLVFAATPKGKVVMGLGMVDAESAEKYSDTFDAILASLKPL